MNTYLIIVKITRLDGQEFTTRILKGNSMLEVCETATKWLNADEVSRIIQVTLIS